MSGKAQIISTFAGTTQGYSGDGGQANIAQLFNPGGIAFDTSGNLYFADAGNNVIRKISTAGIITTVAGIGTGGFSGDGGLATLAQLNTPADVAIDGSGNIYIAEQQGQRIRKINNSGVISTYAGTGIMGFSGDGGLATLANLGTPEGITLDATGNLYIAEWINNRIRKVNLAGIITTIVGNGTAGYTGDGGQATLAQLNNPSSIAIDPANNIYMSDFGNNVIRKINTLGIISTIVGNGTQGYSGNGGAATSASLYGPHYLTIDPFNNIFISEEGNHVIRRVSNTGIISTIAGTGTTGFSGDGGVSTLAQISFPIGVAYDNNGSLYIADQGNNRIRKVTNAISVDELSNEKLLFTIYPNPASNSISLNVSGISNYQNSTIIIQNTLGQTIKKLSFNKNVNVSDLAEGCYFLQITLTNGETYKAKFIKQ